MTLLCSSIFVHVCHKGFDSWYSPTNIS